MSENRPHYWGDVAQEDDIYQKDYLYYIDTDFDEDLEVDNLYDSDYNENFFDQETYKKAAPTNPKRYLDHFNKNDFNGSKWKPKNFIPLIHLRSLYKTAKTFLKELQELNLKDIPAKKTLSTHIKEAKIALRKADRLYEVDQIEALSYILKSIEEGKKVVEKLKFYAAQRKL